VPSPNHHKGMNTHITTAGELAWLTDLHLDATSDARREELYFHIRKSTAIRFLITGDISRASLLPRHLQELAWAAGNRAIYFTLGNHDFYGSSFRAVDQAVAAVCQNRTNLHHLNGSQVIRLDTDTALIGHRGWADGRMGWAERSYARNPDFEAIGDFSGLKPEEAFRLLRKLGSHSASCLRSRLPYALQCYRRVVIATHVPPFTDAARFNGKPCDWLRQPHYCNIALGAMILRVAERFPQKEILILSGHAHSEARVQIADNVTVLTAAARTGFPSAGRTLNFSPGATALT